MAHLPASHLDLLGGAIFPLQEDKHLDPFCSLLYAQGPEEGSAEGKGSTHRSRMKDRVNECAFIE